MALVLDLAGLADALSDPSVDLGADLVDVATEMRASVPSLVCVAWNAVVAHESYTITVIVEGADPKNVHASLAIPLAGRPPSTGSSELVLYAGAPGSFRHLAANPTFLTVAGVTTLSVDRHLEIHDTGDPFATAAVIGRATGVLLARGYSYPEADDQLNQVMTELGCTRRTAAEKVLETLRRPD